MSNDDLDHYSAQWLLTEKNLFCENRIIVT